MANYRIFEFEWFSLQFSKLPNWEQQRVERFALQLAENGPLIGKPLRYPFLREKRFNGNRLYYLIYEEWKVVLLADISDKKEQPETIDRIATRLNELKEFVRQKISGYPE